MAAASISDESLAQGNAGPAGIFWTEAIKTGLNDITVEQSNLILASIAARLFDHAKNWVPAEERGQCAHFELTYGKVTGSKSGRVINARLNDARIAGVFCD